MMLKPVSEHERFKKGFISWNDLKSEQMRFSVASWTHFYHSPYKLDWKDVRKRAVTRKWEIME